MLKPWVKPEKDTMRMLSKIRQYINREANDSAKGSSIAIVFLFLLMSWISLWFLWGILNFLHEAILSDHTFSRITPEVVVSARVSNSGKNPVLHFTTSSKYTFERGIYTPNFEALKEAVATKKQMVVWCGDELWCPAFLRVLMPKSHRPLYQIATDGNVILPFETMKERYRGQIGIAIIFLSFAALGFLFAWFFLYVLRLQFRMRLKAKEINQS